MKKTRFYKNNKTGSEVINEENWLPHLRDKTDKRDNLWMKDDKGVSLFQVSRSNDWLEDHPDFNFLGETTEDNDGKIIVESDTEIVIYSPIKNPKDYKVSGKGSVKFVVQEFEEDEKTQEIKNVYKEAKENTDHILVNGHVELVRA